MSAWDPLLARLAGGPRENGTPAIHETARFLADALARAGAAVELVPFTATPWRLRVAGVVAFAAAVVYWRLVRRGRVAAALAVAVAMPALLVLDFDFGVPLFGRLGAVEQHHVVARIAPARPAQRLILSAHYDTKTDVLDHVARAPVQVAALPVGAVMIVGALLARRRPRLARVAGALAVVQGAALFVSLSAGALVPARSHGAVDDGAACAVLVRLAERLAAGPPLARTAVEVVLFSAEEVGVQGSAAWVDRRFAAPPDLPTAVVNLDPIGTSPDLAVLGGETFVLRGLPPSPALVALLDGVYRRERGRPLPVTWYGGGTDARSFLARGIPAATLVSAEPGHVFPRGLHSARDGRERLDEAALDATLAYLAAVVRAADAGPLPGR